MTHEVDQEPERRLTTRQVGQEAAYLLLLTCLTDAGPMEAGDLLSRVIDDAPEERARESFLLQEPV